MAASRALECAEYALMTNTFHIISYDEVLMTMILTGEDIEDTLRETSRAGLAQTYNLDELARKQRIHDLKSQLAGIQRRGSINMQWGQHESENEDALSMGDLNISRSNSINTNAEMTKEDTMIMLDKSSIFDSFY